MEWDIIGREGDIYADQRLIRWRDLSTHDHWYQMYSVSACGGSVFQLPHTATLIDGVSPSSLMFSEASWFCWSPDGPGWAWFWAWVWAWAWAWLFAHMQCLILRQNFPRGNHCTQKSSFNSECSHYHLKNKIYVLKQLFTSNRLAIGWKMGRKGCSLWRPLPWHEEHKS